MLEEDWGVCLESVGLDGKGNDGWFEVLRPQEKELACGGKLLGEPFYFGPFHNKTCLILLKHYLLDIC